MRTIAAVVCFAILLLMPAASIAQERSDCLKAEVITGIVTWGIIACDRRDLYDRPGTRIILDGIQSCEETAEAKAFRYRGMGDFDNTEKRIGKRAACQALEDAINKATEKTTP
jgi:hypothetical protein